MIFLNFLITKIACQSENYSFFSGKCYCFTKDLLFDSNLTMNLIFYKLYKNQDESEYTLVPINFTENNFIKYQNKNDILYVIGKINIFNSYKIKLQSQFLQIAGIYKLKTYQLFLIHSLQDFLLNKTINDYISKIGNMNQIYFLFFLKLNLFS